MRLTASQSTVTRAAPTVIMAPIANARLRKTRSTVVAPAGSGTPISV